MEISIVQLLYLLRPMLNAKLVDWGLLGFNFFELAAILLFLALAAAFYLRILHKTRHPRPVSGVEVWAALLIGWVTISYIVHIEISSVATYAKFVIPLMTYIMLRRILPDRPTHVRMVFLMLVGLLFPFIISALMIYQGEGLHEVVYWTGLERYKGAYIDAHNLGHNAGFALMLAVVYVSLRKSQRVPLRWAEIMVLAMIAFLGTYLVFAPQVRSVYWGLIACFTVVLYFYDKRALAAFVVVLIGLILAFWSQIAVVFYDFIDPPDLGPDLEAIGSGRKSMWTWALEFWRRAPLLNQLTGMGVTYWDASVARPGRMPRFGAFFDGTLPPWPDPHNDWLYILLSLGLIGLAIFVGLFGAILRAILRIRGKEKFALLGLFLAVMFMNVLSNSYIVRFQMFQMFLMLMVYVDLKSSEVNGKV
jgi:O-antigen ligase